MPHLQFDVAIDFAFDVWVKGAANYVSGSKIVRRLRHRNYYPGIIERTIGLELGPSTTLYKSFL